MFCSVIHHSSWVYHSRNWVESLVVTCKSKQRFLVFPKFIRLKNIRIQTYLAKSSLHRRHSKPLIWTVYDEFSSYSGLKWQVWLRCRLITRCEKIYYLSYHFCSIAFRASYNWHCTCKNIGIALFIHGPYQQRH